MQTYAHRKKPSAGIDEYLLLKFELIKGKIKNGSQLELE